MRSPESASGWQQRRVLSAVLRAAVTLVPVGASLAIGLVANSAVPVATTVPGAVVRAIGILAAALPVLVLVDAGARRFLPLAALLQLSLVFPDQTPSRFRLALKAGSGRRLAQAVGEAKTNGLADDPAAAAEQLVVLATAIGDHDRRTRGHSERVRLYAELIGEGLGLSGDDRAKLQWAALIHDIGKITVAPEILNKKGKPDPDEWAILQRHPAEGEALVGPVEEWLGEWAHAIGGHHERWDGTGYPRGLAGADIPRSAAIVAVADSFEVMTAVRSYKKAMTLADARREMTRCAGSHFSPDVVRAFLNVSIGDLRRSMGLVAALAHVPILGRLTTAASYAPDTVSTAVSMTTSAATAGAGAVAVSAAVAVGTTSMAGADAAPPPPAAIVAAPIVGQPIVEVRAATAHHVTVAAPAVAKVKSVDFAPAPADPAPSSPAEVAPAPASTNGRASAATTSTARGSGAPERADDVDERDTARPASPDDDLAAEQDAGAVNPSASVDVAASATSTGGSDEREKDEDEDDEGSGRGETTPEVAAADEQGNGRVDRGSGASASSNGNHGGDSNASSGGNASGNANAGGNGGGSSNAGSSNAGGNANAGGSGGGNANAGGSGGGSGNGNAGGSGGGNANAGGSANAGGNDDANGNAGGNDDANGNADAGGNGGVHGRGRGGR